MSIPYNEIIINDRKDLKLCYLYSASSNFIGYLTPTGKPYSLKYPFTFYKSHDAFPAVAIFMSYFKTGISDPKPGSNYNFFVGGKKEKNNIDAKSLLSKFNKYSDILKNFQDSNRSEWTIENCKLTLGIIEYLYNCHNSKLGFFDSCGNPLFIPIEELNENEDEYKKPIFKDIVVQVLDYDSVERAPRTITTSKLNIYEKFYNYFLMDFVVQQIPKMFYDNEQERYIKLDLPEFLVPDSELRLKDEIEAIKKYVPVKERMKYFR